MDPYSAVAIRWKYHPLIDVTISVLALPQQTGGCASSLVWSANIPQQGANVFYGHLAALFHNLCSLEGRQANLHLQ